MRGGRDRELLANVLFDHVRPGGDALPTIDRANGKEVQLVRRQASQGAAHG